MKFRGKAMKALAAGMAAVLSLSAVSCVSTDASLWSYQEGEGDIRHERGIESQSIENDERLIVMRSAGIENGEGSMVVGIHNKDDGKYHFLDTDIEIYGGNADTGRWKRLGEWSATDYYRNRESAVNASNVLLGIAGGLTIADAIFGDIFFDVSIGSDGTSHIETTRYWDFGDALITTLLVSGAMDTAFDINRDSMDWLSRNLLFSTTIGPDQEYGGVMFFNAEEYPDYKFSVRSSLDEEPMEFIYQRSDREDMLHPWRDSSHEKHVLASSWGWIDESFGMTYLWLQPRGAGSYTGLRFKFPTADITSVGTYDMKTGDIRLDRELISSMEGKDPRDFHLLTDGARVNDEVDWSLGMTIKLFPHAWLLLGGNMQWSTERAQRGTLKYTSSTGEHTYPEKVWLSDDRLVFGVSPQFGLNLAFNMLDFYVMGSYDMIDRRFTVDTGLGLAF